MATLIVGLNSLVGGTLFALCEREQDGQVIGTTRRTERAGTGSSSSSSIASRVVFLDLNTVCTAADVDAWWSREAPAGLAPGGLRGVAICAAVARLGDCEKDPGGTRRVNVTSVGALAWFFGVRHGVPVVFCSSDKVYDGTKARQPREDTPRPVTEYGRQKRDAEAELLAMLSSTPACCIAILRLSKVISPNLALFRGWAESIKSDTPVTAFSDMMLAPVPVDLVAATLARILRERRSGVFQLSGSRDVTYVDAAHCLCDAIGKSRSLVRPVLSLSTPPPVPNTTLDMTVEHSIWSLDPPETIASLSALAASFTKR